MKTRQDIINEALAEKLERSNNLQRIADKQIEINHLQLEIEDLRRESMEGHELSAISDLTDEIYAQWEKRGK